MICPKDDGREKRQIAPAGSKRGNSRIGIGLAVFGALFMAFGIYRGELPIVLQKAINICMECIGIG